jgi:ribose transport system ATP-binding protein
MPSEFKVEMQDIKKHYGGVQALKGFSFQVKPGEIRALVGENGAGKSTLVKILSGAVKKDSGLIRIDGREVEIHSPKTGKELGVSIIYQEFALVPDLTVAENIFINKLGGGKGVVNWKDLYRKADEIIQSIGININTHAQVKDLSVAYQQVVEIAKALSEKSGILILDEPTAVLAPQETESLFKILFRLKEKGVSIIYISHRLEEIFQIADKITVMRDGEVTGTFDKQDVTIKEVMELMIGRELTTLFPPRSNQIGEEILKVENFSSPLFKDIAFNVKKGEVVGFSGLVGSGRTEVARAVFGADKKKSGRLVLEGKETAIRSPRDAVKKGIGLMPENRKKEGLILAMPIKTNISFASLKKVSTKIGWIKKEKEKAISQELIKALSIKTDSADTCVQNLSGGNQQKVVFAKWFNAGCKVVLLDEPTRGVDVGAKVEIYNLINQFAAEGLGVIIISSEMLELIGMCDRVYVFNGGRIKGEIAKPEITEKNIMKTIMGEC